MTRYTRRSIANIFPSQIKPAPSPISAGDPGLQQSNDVLTSLRAVRRKRDTRAREPVASFRGVPKTLMRDLKIAADRYGVLVADLARFLLEHGLVAHQTGQRLLIPELTGHYTLYPAESDWNAIPVQTTVIKKKRKTAPEVASFRNLPEELRTGIDQLAEHLCVPKGQLVRKLLENGLEALESGAIRVQLYEVNTPLRRSFYD